MPWHSRLSLCLQHWHPAWTPVQVLVAPLQVQVPTNPSGKATENDPAAWAPALRRETRQRFQSPGFGVGLAPTIAATGGVSQRREDVSPTLPFKLLKKKKVCNVFLWKTELQRRSDRALPSAASPPRCPRWPQPAPRSFLGGLTHVVQ